MTTDRRGFVYSLAALIVAPPAALLGSAAPADDSTAGLTAEEKATLGDICEQIIPADEFAGAKQAGVVTFIDRLLNEAHPDWIVVYRTGLRAAELSCRELHDRRFSELGFDEQTEFLKKMERGDLPAHHWYGISGGEFFSMVRSHTMQGYYGHPRWGGNRDRVAWKMIGYDDFWA